MEFLSNFFFAIGLIFFMVRLLRFVDIKTISKDNNRFWRYVSDNKNVDLSEWDKDMKKKMYTEMSLAIWVISGVLTYQWVIFICYFLVTMIMTLFRGLSYKVEFLYYTFTLKLLVFQIIFIAFIVINHFHLHIPVDLNACVEYLKQLF